MCVGIKRLCHGLTKPLRNEGHEKMNAYINFNKTSNKTPKSKVNYFVLGSMAALQTACHKAETPTPTPTSKPIPSPIPDSVSRGNTGVTNISGGVGIMAIINANHSLADLTNPNGTGIDLSQLTTVDNLNNDIINDALAGEIIDGGLIANSYLSVAQPTCKV